MNNDAAIAGRVAALVASLSTASTGSKLLYAWGVEPDGHRAAPLYAVIYQRTGEWRLGLIYPARAEQEIRFLRNSFPDPPAAIDWLTRELECHEIQLVPYTRVQTQHPMRPAEPPSRRRRSQQSQQSQPATSQPGYPAKAPRRLLWDE